MKNIYRLAGYLAILAIAIGLLISAAPVMAEESAPQGPPEAHAAMPDYTGPETCLTCHPDAGKEVAESLHYQHQGPAPYLVGANADQYYGMFTTF